MKRPFFCLFLALTLFISTVLEAQTRPVGFLHSPKGLLQLTLLQNAEGALFYQLNYKDKAVLRPSPLGFQLKNPAVLLRNFSILRTDSSRFMEDWKPVWGQSSLIRNEYCEYRLLLATPQPQSIQMELVFRLFDDGLGFRYSFPEQGNLKHFVVADELTGFALTGDHKAFWIPGDYDTNEYAYNTTLLSEVNALATGPANEIHAKTTFDANGVQTPLMLKTRDPLYINLHEAALLNYPAMNLVIDKKDFVLKAHLVPDAAGNKAYLQTPFRTPWRTVIVSDDARKVLASNLILNLNDPSVLTHTEWIRPQKFVGVWWEMHVGRSSWDYSGTQAGMQNNTLKPHGANTKNVKRYIDFAAAQGIPSVLVEGWNTGWEDWFGQWKEDVFDFVTPYPDFNVAELREYAKSKGVKLIMHHETSGSVTNYERWMDSAYRFMKENGYEAVKTGYVGRIIPRGEHHDSQWMIRHFERVARKTGSYGIMLDAHEPVRPTGLHRTFPNWMASEAARGNEFNAWSVGNPPEHETILPFTRLMGGPMDYTPGIFRIKMSHYDSSKTEQVHTTLAKQLALYVTLYSPLQMVADLPENYEARADAFQFIKDVAVDWDRTEVLEAEPGDYISIARKAKGSPQWFAGCITDEQARMAVLPLAFLPADESYVAVVYRDADDAHWKENPEACQIERFLVDSKTILNLRLAAGGGAAIQLRPALGEERKSLKKYVAKKITKARQ